MRILVKITLIITICVTQGHSYEYMDANTISRGIDYAAEDAANGIIQALEKRDIKVGNIAFLPLFKDKQNLYTVVRNELSSIESNYRFFMRESDDLNKLINEIKFGDMRSDIMNQSTIQKFGSIEGVEALLYGEVREAGRLDDENFIVRLSLVLADVESGHQIASANVTGMHRIEIKKVDVAEPSLAKKASEILEENFLLGLDEASEKILVESPSFFEKNQRIIFISLISLIGILIIKSLIKKILSMMERPR